MAYSSRAVLPGRDPLMHVQQLEIHREQYLDPVVDHEVAPASATPDPPYSLGPFLLGLGVDQKLMPEDRAGEVRE